MDRDDTAGAARGQTPLPVELHSASAWLGYPARCTPAAKLQRRQSGPAQLWVVGAVPGRGPRIGIVGARKATFAQCRAAQTLSAALVRAGATIVSGGAAGIDSVAHHTAVTAGGRTVVCLPAGVRDGGNLAQRSLCEEVLRAGGAVVSCEAPSTAHAARAYRRRNEVIVSLIDALVVVCGGDRSGTLITARFAEEADLPRRVIPWAPGTASSDGSNRLLTSGWRAVIDLDDGAAALEQLLRDQSIDGTRPGWQRYAPPPSAEPPPLRGTANTDTRLLAAVEQALQKAGPQGLSLEEMVQNTGEARGDVAALLLHLQMTSQVQPTRFGRHALCSRSPLAKPGI